MDWYTCADPEAMLKLVAPKATPAQAVYLFMAAMERVHHLLTTEAIEGLSEMERQWCDDVSNVDHGKIAKGRNCKERETGGRSWSISDAARWNASDAYCVAEDTIHPVEMLRRNIRHTRNNRFDRESVFLCISRAISFDAGLDRGEAEKQTLDWLCPLIREVFPPMVEGKCFQCAGFGTVSLMDNICQSCGGTGKGNDPLSFNTGWRTLAVVGIAEKMHETKDFASMPILYDALMEAGCENPYVLEHCRNTDGHYRGCWLLQMIMEK